MNTYTGLTAAICCIGACYAGSGDAALPVRDMVDCLRAALNRDCDLDAVRDTSIQPAASQLDLEKMLAYILLHIMLVWNGSAGQRECGLQTFPLLADFAKKSGLTQISSNSQGLYSILHQHQPLLPALDPHDFDWPAWLQQEARIRVFYMLFECDVANALYFNAAAEFNGLNIELPLPADDAAWEANSSEEAARALNLCGNEAVRLQNPDGSQRSRQPELGLALRALLCEPYQMHPGSTNLHGKFIIIHAILAHMRSAQLTGNQSSALSDPIQLNENDWIIMERGTSLQSTTDNGLVTPVRGYRGIEPHMYKSLRMALAKFKANWDMDMAIQFPPATFNTGRWGFSRDGIHYFWLASWMLEHTTANDLVTPADHRFLQVIHLVKSVKAWVISDGASRGEELGSIGDIHQQYGATDLTLDMAKLFTPIPAMVDDPNKTIKAEP